MDVVAVYGGISVGSGSLFVVCSSLVREDGHNSFNPISKASQAACGVMCPSIRVASYAAGVKEPANIGVGLVL